MSSFTPPTGCCLREALLLPVSVSILQLSSVSIVDCLNFLVLRGAVGGAKVCAGRGGGGGGFTGGGGGGRIGGMGGGGGGGAGAVAARVFSASSACFNALSNSDSTNFNRSSRISVWELDSSSSSFSY